MTPLGKAGRLWRGICNWALEDRSEKAVETCIKRHRGSIKCGSRHFSNRSKQRKRVRSPRRTRPPAGRTEKGGGVGGPLGTTNGPTDEKPTETQKRFRRSTCPWQPTERSTDANCAKMVIEFLEAILFKCLAFIGDLAFPRFSSSVHIVSATVPIHCVHTCMQPSLSIDPIQALIPALLLALVLLLPPLPPLPPLAHRRPVYSSSAVAFASNTTRRPAGPS